MTQPLASAYVRLSKAADSSNLSREGMVSDLGVLAERHGYRLAAVHVDDGITGGLRDRPAFKAWLDDGRSGDFAALLAWDVSRMTREGLNVAAIILDVVEGKSPDTGRIVSRPVRLLDFSGLDSEDEESFRFSFAIKAEIARAERARMVVRNRAARERLVSAGRYGGGVPPYGLHAVPLDPSAKPDKNGRVPKILVPHPAEAAVIERVAAYLLEGWSPGAVARQLNSEGVPPRRGGSWTRATIRGIVEGPGAHAVIGQEVMTELADAFAARATVPTFDGRPRRWLTGVATCSGCKRGLGTRTLGEKRRTVYACSSRHSGHGCDRPVTVKADWLDAFVEAALLPFLEREELRAASVVVEGSEALHLAEAAVASFERALLASPSAEAVEELLAARAELVAAPRPTRRTEYRPTGRTAADVWRDADPLTRRELAREWVAILEVRPGASSRKELDPARVRMRVFPSHWNELDPEDTASLGWIGEQS